VDNAKVRTPQKDVQNVKVNGIATEHAKSNTGKSIKPSAKKYMKQ